MNKKKILTLLTGMFFTSASLALEPLAPESQTPVWTAIAVTEEGTVLSFDVHNYVKDPSSKYVAVWGKRMFAKPKDFSFLKKVVVSYDQVLINCEDKKWGLITQFMGAEGSKDLVTTIDISADKVSEIRWDTFPPNSGLGYISKKVCGKPSKDWRDVPPGKKIEV